MTTKQTAARKTSARRASKGVAQTRLHKKVAAALAKLAQGETLEGVARLLREAGITGYRSDPFACPVAEYLKQSCRGLGAVQVGCQDTMIFSTRQWRGWRHYRLPSPTYLKTPPLVSQFVREFDRTTQRWPELLAEEEGVEELRS